MYKMKKQKGITLVALVITIIVLLILAVVAINAIQNDGIIDYAKNARSEYEKAEAIEQNLLSSYIDEIVTYEMAELYDVDSVTSKNALRFRAKIKQNISGVEIQEIGFIYIHNNIEIYSKDNLDEIELTLETEDVRNNVMEKYYAIEGDFWIYVCTITNAPEDTRIKGRFYIRYKYNGQEKIMYTNAITTSRAECISNGKVSET